MQGDLVIQLASYASQESSILSPAPKIGDLIQLVEYLACTQETRVQVSESPPIFLGVFQLVEFLTWAQEVAGSSPATQTTNVIDKEIYNEYLGRKV